MPRVLLLASGGSYRTADYAAAAQGLGVEVLLAGESPPALATSSFSVLEVRFEPMNEALTTLLAASARSPVDAVVATDDSGARLAAAVARALGCRHAAPGGVDQALDKFRFRECLRQAALPGPDFELVNLDVDVAAAARRAQFPCVLKPLCLNASRGVIRVDDESDFIAAARRIGELLRAEPSLLSNRHRHFALREDFIPGAEVALDGLLRDGELHVLALFDKPDPLDGPFFEETLFVTPSRHPVRSQRAVADQVEAAAAALGLVEGPVHAEARVRDGRVVLLELAPRIIGGLCSRSLRFAAGASEEELVLRHALGWPLHNLRREQRASGVLMIPVPRDGRLESVRGVEAVRALAGVDAVSLTAAPGDRLRPAPEGGRYPGFVFASAESATEVESILREAMRRIELVMRAP